MTEKKEKKYVGDNVQLMAEWDWEKNNELGFNPKELTCGSHKKVWWICTKSHKWQASISDRNNGTRCPFCAGQKVLQGFNDLLSNNPTLAKEWNYIKNDNLKPESITANSSKKVWWICKLGHEWQAKVCHRNNGIGCPYCAGQKVIQGFNDLQTINPNLAEEWNYEKNNNLVPTVVTSNSGKKVWWKCKKGHEWQATISNRNKGFGCPICISECHTSFPEYALLYYFKQCNLDVIHLYKDSGYELDIYIPSKKVAIEYDGEYWHKNKKRKDIEKNNRCKIDGIKLYRIRENLPSLNDYSIDITVQSTQEDLTKIIKKILNEIIDDKIDIDITRDAIDIENLRVLTEKENSLLLSNPILAKEWNFQRNGILKPENFKANSNKKVWWKCENGHEWQAWIAGRNEGDGCPYCSGRLATKGINDLQTINPILSKEWHYEKNNGLIPSDVKPNSHKKVWWKCQEGHEWESSIKHRNKGSGCPECAKLRRKNGKV